MRLNSIELVLASICHELEALLLLNTMLMMIMMMVMLVVMVGGRWVVDG